MASASPLSASFASPSEAPYVQARPSDDPLDADLIGYGAWLLPPAKAGLAERVVRTASWVAGPAALLALSLLAVPIIF